MKRKILTVFILGILCISMVACNQSAGEKSKPTTDEIKKIDVRENELGLEFNLPDKWKESQGKHFDMYKAVPEGNITGQLVISFISDETIEKANAINAEADKIPETDKEAIQKAAAELRKLLDEFKEVCSIVTIDKSTPEGDKQKELFSKYDNNPLSASII